MRYRSVIKILILLLAIQIICFTDNISFAAETNSVQDNLDLANEFVDDKLGIANFYKKNSLSGEAIRNDLALTGNKDFLDHPLSVNGTAVDGWKDP